jgi:hypothetical protein
MPLVLTRERVMKTARPIEMRSEQRIELKQMVRSQTLEVRAVRRAPKRTTSRIRFLCFGSTNTDAESRPARWAIWSELAKPGQRLRMCHHFEPSHEPGSPCVICEALDQEPSALRLKHCVTMKRNKSFAPLDRESTRPEITRMSASLLPVAASLLPFRFCYSSANWS